MTVDNASSGRNDNTHTRTLQEPLLAVDNSSSSLNRNDNNSNYADINKDIVFPRIFNIFCCRSRTSSAPPLKLNHNVALNLLLCLLYGTSDSLWSGTALAAYLKKIGNGQNSPVGYIEAASGLAALVSALPVGWVADKFGRSKVISCGGFLFVATAILHIFLITWIGVDEDKIASHNKGALFWLMGLIMSLWGLGGGIVQGPSQALYADSTPPGSRSIYYQYLFVTYLFSSILGPLVTIVLFQTIGDNWSLYQLRLILYVGLGLETLNAVVMMFFDDKKALDESDDDNNDDDSGESEASSYDESQDDDIEIEKSDEENGVALNASLEENNILSEEEQLQIQEEEKQHFVLSERQKYVPYISFISAVIMAVGSGMTVKFFPLFFKDEVNMSPSQVQLIYVLVPITMAIFSGIATKLSSSFGGFGRVQTILLYDTAGVGLLVSMVIFKSYLDRHPIILVPIYILRTALMNATYPLHESILMDFVPKNTRSRWKSLDSIASFGWCGSAALGGWLADKYDYTYTFSITALLQLIGTILYAFLLPLVPRKEEDLATPQTTITVSSSMPTTSSSSITTSTTSIAPTSRCSSLEDTTQSSSSLLQEPLLSTIDTADE